MSASPPHATEKPGLIHPAAMDLAMFATAQSQQSYLVDLSHLGLIRVNGADAESFLQGQFSNDPGLLENHQSQLHAYCNPKGRTLAIIRLMRSGDGFWMVVPQDLCASLLKRLKMFVLRAKVNMHIDDARSLLGMVGYQHTRDKQQDNRGEQYLVDPGRADMPMARHLIISEEIHHPAGHGDLWRWMDIRAGIPQVYAQTTAAFIPQMVNLDRVEGISFKKGCYPGQEIIARIKYLGKLKQRMIIATVHCATEICPGDAVFNPEKPEQKSGLVVDAVKTGETETWLSATVPTTMIESGALRVGSASGPQLHRSALPYSII